MRFRRSEGRAKPSPIATPMAKTDSRSRATSDPKLNKTQEDNREDWSAREARSASLNRGTWSLGGRTWMRSVLSRGELDEPLKTRPPTRVARARSGATQILKPVGQYLDKDNLCQLRALMTQASFQFWCQFVRLTVGGGSGRGKVRAGPALNPLKGSSARLPPWVPATARRTPKLTRCRYITSIIPESVKTSGGSKKFPF